MSVGYNPKIITNGLVLCLDAANIKSYLGSGATWNDLSGTNNTGSLVNSPTFSSSNLGYFSFNGTTQYASVPYSSTLDFATALTVSLWFYSGTNYNNTAQTAVYLKGRTDVDNYAPLFHVNGAYAWGVQAASTMATYDQPANYILSNTWYNLVVSHTSGSNPNIYRNAELSTGHTYGLGNGTYPLITNLNPLSINADVPRGAIGPFNGRIAAIHAYNRELSAAEVLQNFNALRGRFNI